MRGGIPGLSPAILLFTTLALLAAPAGAETLGALLASRGLRPTAADVPRLAETVQSASVLDDGAEVVALYALGEGGSARLYATRFARARGAWQTSPVEWSGGDLPMEFCRGGMALDRFGGGYLAKAHINPSAECTVVLGADLRVRGVLAGWPVAALPGGRLVYQRNQVHFAPVHPVALALWDPGRAGDVPLYPRRPSGAARRAHVAAMRAVYTEAWCRAHNHPCDPEVFDEQVVGEVAVDAAGDALAVELAWDDTAGWSDAERWGRLEAFRELRAALPGWDGTSPPPPALFGALAAGLSRIRNLGREGNVADALAGDPPLNALVGAALAAPPPAGADARAWLESLDPLWARPSTWAALARAAAVPDELTRVIHVCAGLADPDRLRCGERSRRELESRFGPFALRRALDPDALREIAGPR